MHDVIQTPRDDDDVLAGLIRALGDRPVGADDVVRVDRIRLLEELKSAAAAAQARETAAFVDSQRATQRAAGVRAERCELGIASQVGLAMRCSPYRARRQVAWSKITGELPETFAQLQAGRTTEWRAMLVARETGWLSREHRSIVDAELGPRLESLGDKRVEAEAKKLAYGLDPQGYVNRLRQVENDRHVGIRPAPDVMCRLSALLPVRDGIASHTALSRDADALKATGDPRSKSQIMADLLVERVTGQAVAGGVPVEVNLTMNVDVLVGRDGTEPNHGTRPNHGTEPNDDADSVDALGADVAGSARSDAEAEPDSPDAADGADAAGYASPAGSDEPAFLHGYGPIPAPLARDWLLDPHRTGPVWLRRLFTRPDTGELIGVESRRRLFTPAQARFIRLRDQTCRTPWCEAPIRHTDHVTPAEDKGPTTVRNGQGLCEACNYAKAAPSWHARSGPSGTVIIETPTGHRYVSRPPDLPGRPPDQARSSVERHFVEIIYAHTHAA